MKEDFRLDFFFFQFVEREFEWSQKEMLHVIYPLQLATLKKHEHPSMLHTQTYNIHIYVYFFHTSRRNKEERGVRGITAKCER